MSKVYLYVVSFVEEVYVEQPPRFENFEFPNHVFKPKWFCIDLNKFLELSMNILASFLFQKVFQWERWAQLFH